MMALLWNDVLADIASAKMHFGQAVSIYEQNFDDLPASAPYVPAMAFQHAMQSGYGAFEAAAKRLLLLLDEPLPIGSDWHVTLLRRIGQPIPGARPAILGGSLLAQMAELRRFRHLAMHSYDDFDPRRAVLPTEAARAFLAEIDEAIVRFRAAIDPED